MKFLSLLVPLYLFVYILYQDLTFAQQGFCRRLKFTTPVDGFALEGHVIKNISLSIGMRSSCRGRCTIESKCISINIGPPIKDQVICQLSDSDHTLHPEDLKPQEGFTYRGTENACSSRPCFDNATCLNGYTDKRYLCVCQPGYTGENCEIAGDLSSCKEQYDKHKSTKSQVLPLMLGSQKIPVYCHMGNFGCGDGGWTLAMKIDGNKRTFPHNSHFWGDRNGYNLAGGKTGFDTQETKLPTYWNTSFSKICLGMKIGQQINFITINKTANSLYSLIADGQYRATSLGRNTWKTLIGSQASLQTNCNKEGFNARCSNNHKARIGVLGNNEKDCITCDSRIGFGITGSPTCGNAQGRYKIIKAMGYILVQ